MFLAFLRDFWAGLIFLALLVAPGSADGLSPGLWEITTRVDVGAGEMPAGQTQRCMKPDDTADLAKTFSPVSRTINSPCRPLQSESTPSHLAWRLVCQGQIDMEVAGDFNFYRPDHYSASILAVTTIPGGGQQRSRSVIEARRVGDCPAEEQPQ